MTPARALAVTFVGLSLAMVGVSMASLAVPSPNKPSPFDVLILMTSFTAFPTVGLIVAWKRPDHPIGWLLLAVGLSLIVAIFSTEYPNLARYGGMPLPAVEWVAMLGWVWMLGAGLALPLVLLTFPDGRLPGRRWRPVVAVGSAFVIGVTAMFAIVPGEIEGSNGLRNPIGIGGPLGDVAEAVAEVGTLALLVMTVIGLAGMVAKFRASRGVERQQFKWLLYPAAIFLIGLGLASIGPAVEWGWSAALLALPLIPVAIGIAILRYRLYDIDVVIRRTLVYGAVVAILGALYVGLVLALQGVLAGLTGGGTLPVAVSTLVIAALFGPVRSRVRALVDRRFYRSRYDAQRTVEAFASRLRDQVELEAVGRTLATAADEAVRPASVGVWIRRRAP